MDVLIDFHSHIYPIYDLRKTHLFAAQGLDSVSVLFLTERFDCSFFEEIRENNDKHNTNLKLKNIDSNCTHVGEKVFLIRGRQFASKEGIEVLSLFASPNLEEKLPAKIYCQEILNKNGIIAFSWAFGKWRGQRASLIESLALEYGNKNVVLLDSRLRPNILPLPKQFSDLEKKGFRIFVGSDPLPLSSHQNKLGALSSLFENQNIEDINSESLKKLVLENSRAGSIGQHSGLLEFFRDQISLRIGR